MTAALLFAANFTIVFLMGVQQLTVQRGAMIAAFCISPFITGASIVLFKVLPQETTMLDNVVHMLGGSFGIVAGMWMHAQVLALFQPPRDVVKGWRPSRPMPPAPAPAPAPLASEAERASKMKAFRKYVDEMPSTSAHAVRLGETLRLATELADDVARSDIESYCAVEHSDKHDWYDTHHSDPATNNDAVAKAVRYLDLRNRVIHHPQQPHLVRFER